jgi:hypothetical protein
MRASSRYYAMYADIRDVFGSKCESGWQVYDREALTPEGEVCAIAFCINKPIAYAIRDALNATQAL